MSTRSTGRTENVLTRNVRLFTFLTVIAVFLIGAVAFGVMVYGDVLFPMPENDTRPDMTVEELRALCARANAVTGTELSAFRGENYDRSIDGVVVEKYYYVNEIGGRYNLSATERVSDRRIMYLTLYDLETKRMYDLLDGSVDVGALFGN